MAEQKYKDKSELKILGNIFSSLHNITSLFSIGADGKTYISCSTSKEKILRNFDICGDTKK